MKILHVIKDLEPGGIQTLLLDTCNNRQLLGAEMAILVIGGGRLEKTFENSGVKLFKVRRKHLVDLRAILQIRKIIKDLQPDVIHTHHSLELLYAIAGSFGLKVKKVHTHHTHPFINNLKDKLAYSVLLHACDSIVFPSVYLKKEYAAFEAKSRVIYNGVDENRAISKLGKAVCRKKLNLPQDKFILGMAGSFYNSIRDQAFLCEALPPVFHQNPDATMLFAGAPGSLYFKNESYFEHCQRICRENGIGGKVIFTGNVEEINLFYGAIDLYVHCSKKDTFGLAVAEALINRKPVLANDLAVFKELYAGAGNINFFKTGDKKDFQEKTYDMLKQLKKEAKPHSVPFTFPIKNHIKALRQLYVELIEGKN